MGTRRKLSPESAAAWGVVAPVYVGVFGLTACFLVWFGTFVVTGRGLVEPAFLTAFGALLAVGQGAQALAALRQPPPDPDEMHEDQ